MCHLEIDSGFHHHILHCTCHHPLTFVPRDPECHHLKLGLHLLECLLLMDGHHLHGFLLLTTVEVSPIQWIVQVHPYDCLPKKCEGICLLTLDHHQDQTPQEVRSCSQEVVLLFIIFLWTYLPKENFMSAIN